MMARIKAWMRWVLIPTRRWSVIDASVSRSGAVEYDVQKFLISDEGQEQLKEVRALTDKLKLKLQ
jgi:hypothetical protein